MALNETQQLYEALKQSENTLITFRHDHNGDAIAASLALSLFFNKLNKNHEIVCHNFDWPKTYEFLKQNNTIET